MLDCGWAGYRERASDMVGSVSTRHMTNDTIAAVIPVYNKERYVAQAISSVLSRPVLSMKSLWLMMPRPMIASIKSRPFAIQG
jgi:hypothetical protein